MTTHQRPSFQLKLRRNAWVAGALPQTPLGDLTQHSPRPLPAQLMGHTFKGEKRRERRGEATRGEVVPLTFWEKVTPLNSISTADVERRRQWPTLHYG